MEKRKTFHGRQVGKKRLLPIVFPLFLFLLIPLNGYGDDTPMPEVVQQNSTRITGVVKDAYGEPVIGANVKVVGTTQGTITDFEGKFSINVSGASAKIKISFIGYKDKEVTAKKGVSLNVVQKVRLRFLSLHRLVSMCERRIWSSLILTSMLPIII